MPDPAFPPGHFYSPIVDTADVEARAEQVWPAQPVVQGIDFDDASHEQILRTVFPRFIADYAYPEHGDEAAPAGFFTQNSQFSWLDARALFVLLRHLAPRRIVEVGSGFSTLLIEDVIARWLGGGTDLVCIEPYPRRFLRERASLRVIERKVQEVPLSAFETLEPGEVLFIDSSHVAKTGSDVNFLYFEVLPRLSPGVWIHVHDIFLPHDYPRDWVLEEGRSWNEEYLLRALLMHSTGFRPVFGCSYAFWRFPALVRDALARPDGAAFGGGSFWMRRLP